MAQNFYEQYIAELLKKAALVDENGQIDQDYVKKLAPELEKKMGLMIFDELDKKNLEQYTKLVDQKASAEEMAKFFQENISEFEQKRMKVLEDFALAFLQRTAKLRKSLE